MSRNQLRDWADLAEEQGWKTVQKPGGKWVFYPPQASVPTDLRVLNITEPLNEGNRSFDNIRALLKRAGLRFPEDSLQERRQTSMPSSNSMSIATAPIASTVKREPTLDDLVAEAHLDINAAVDSLSKLGERLGKIQACARASAAGYEKVRALAQALKEI